MDALAQLNASLAGKYSIEREIGRGGMAAVYLARDLRHSRPVALKVLNPELGAVLGVQRFLGEIRVTANLQHPNILPLFDSGEAEGLLFYVMPYIEGESLRQRLTREKQLPVDEAIHIATAVGTALEYAHRHGVIHRDLKPENILLSESQPLVADFGIALALSKAGGERITQTGVSLGTPQYMSPEQATGDRPLDGRTDIYSLGALAYEMLTGDPPHTASTSQAIIAKVLTEAPQDIRVQRPHVPAHVAAAIERALEKLPADRWHTARQFAEALQGGKGGVAIPPGSQTPGSVERLIHQRTWRRKIRTPRVAAVAVAFAAAAVLGFTAWRLWAGFGAERSVSFHIDPPAPAGVRENIEAIAISPDGQTLAFVSQSDSSSQIYLRRLSEVQARPLSGTNGAAHVAFSPDGKWLAILTFSGRLLKAAVDGSSVLTLAETQEFWGGLAWEGTRAILLGRGAVAGRGIARIAASGGTPRPVTKPAPTWEHGRPLVVGDGNTLLFVDWGPGFIEDDFLAIGSLKTGEYTRTSLVAAAPLGVVDNWIVYDNGAGAIMAAPFGARSRRTTGDPVRVVEDVTITGALEAALSPGGTLVYKRGQPRQRLVLVDPAGAVKQVTAQERPFFPFFGGRPTLSPDGRRVAVNLPAQRDHAITVDIWTIDRQTGTLARLTSLGDVVSPEWTPDGKHLVFFTWESRRPKLWRQLADGSAPPETLLALPDGYQIVSAAVTPDGRGVTYCAWRIQVMSRPELFYVPLAGDRKPERLDVGPLAGLSCAARVSPDGRWLAYVGSDGPRTNVYVRSFRGTAGLVQVSAEGGDSPVWSRDGKRLYYRRIEAGMTSGSLVVAQVSQTATGFRVDERERILTLREGGVYDVAPDGRHVLVVQQGDSRVQLVVTTNWTSLLRARLAEVR